ncbi:MAG TPA: isochorismatase family protein, partial [Vineibacter sp.]|nr:isochorismatase family protein [Vineibacter sp.]
MRDQLDRRSLLKSAGMLALAAGGGALLPGAARAQVKIGLTAKDALVVVDVQRCFTKGGSLAVPDGDAVVPLINGIAKKFANVVMTQDWHSPGHISFASSHAGKKPFDVIDLPYGKQVLWPDHCIQGTEGAELHSDLSIPHAQLVIRKGYNPRVD